MKWRKWLVIYLSVSISFVRIALAQQSPDLPASSDDASNRASAVNAAEVKLSGRARAAVDIAIENIIDISIQSGKREDVIKWEARRGKPVTVGEVREITNICEDLRSINELLLAQRLSVQLQTVAVEIKNDEPGVFALIQLILSYLDSDFERYESAQQRFDSCFEIIAKGKVATQAESERDNRTAYLLKKRGKNAEAEELYLRVIKEASAKPDAVSRDVLLSAKFELAAMYVDMGAFEQAKKLMPKEDADWYDEDGKVDPDRLSLMLTSNVKFWMIDDKDLDMAAKICDELVDRMQHYDGVASRPYAESIELMAQIRVAQKRYSDAEELLKKSAGIRAGLFGDEHPSVARVHKEIDRVRRLARDEPGPIWQAPKLEEREVDDRYGSAEGSKATAKEVKK